MPAVVGLFAILFLVACAACRKAEAPIAGSGVSLDRARLAYAGPADAQKALRLLEEAPDAGPEHFRFGLEICLDALDEKRPVPACGSYFRKQVDRGGDGRQAAAMVALAYATYAVSGLEPECISESFRGALTLPVTAKEQNAFAFQAGLRAVCEGKGDVAERSFAHLAAANERGRDLASVLVIPARSFLIRIALSERDGFFYRRGMRLLHLYRYKYLKDLLAVRSPSAPGTVVRALLDAELVNPYSGVAIEHPGGKSHPYMLTRVNAGRKAIPSDCGRPGCRLLRAEFLRVTGEIEHTRVRYPGALVDYEACAREFLLPGCLEGIAYAAEAAGREDIYRKYADRIESLLQGSIFAEARKAQGSAVSEGGAFFSRAEEREVRLVNDPRLLARARAVLAAILGNPYLRGRFPYRVELHLADFNNAEAIFTQGRGQLYIGAPFVAELLARVGRGELPRDLDEDALLAALIGHEVHHLAAGHHVEFCSIVNQPRAFRVEAVDVLGREREHYAAQVRSEKWRREFEADEMGMLYAYLAGYRARGVLALHKHWHDLRPFDRLNSSHPPHFLRLRHLAARLRILQIADARLRNGIAAVERARRLSESGRTDGIAALLAQAERDFAWFDGQFPGHPTLAVNRSYIALRLAALADIEPELPTFPLVDDSPGFRPPVGGIAEHGAQGEKRARPGTLQALRPSMRRDPWRCAQNSATCRSAQASLRAARSAAESGLRLDPHNGRLLNNLGLSYYIDAQMIVRRGMAAAAFATPAASPGRPACELSGLSRRDCAEAVRLLRHSETLLRTAALRLPGEQARIHLNLAAALVARRHLETFESAPPFSGILALLVRDPDAFLRGLDPQTGASAVRRVDFLNIELEALGGFFLVPYLAALHYLPLAQDLVARSADRPELKELLAAASDRAGALFPKGSPSNYWHRELQTMRLNLKGQTTTRPAPEATASHPGKVAPQPRASGSKGQEAGQ